MREEAQRREVQVTAQAREILKREKEIENEAKDRMEQYTRELQHLESLRSTLLREQTSLKVFLYILYIVSLY